MTTTPPPSMIEAAAKALRDRWRDVDFQGNFDDLARAALAAALPLLATVRPDRDDIARAIDGHLDAGPALEDEDATVCQCGYQIDASGENSREHLNHIADMALAVLAEQPTVAEVKREGHREGSDTARQDMASGAFVGGPAYEAVRDSFTGRRIAAEALREAADALWDESETEGALTAVGWLRARATHIEAGETR